MKECLIVYSTLEGQTKKIADRIADRWRERGCSLDVVSANAAADTLPWDRYAVVAIGGSIHIGHHQTTLKRFVERHREALATHPRTAFFSVSLSAASRKPEARREAEDLMKSFLKQTDWQPAVTQTFAGAVRWKQYGFFKRRIMRRIVREENPGTDVDLDHDLEYTDWDAVDRFADELSR